MIVAALALLGRELALGSDLLLLKEQLLSSLATAKDGALRTLCPSSVQAGLAADSHEWQGQGTEAYPALFTQPSSRRRLGVCLLQTLEFAITVGSGGSARGWRYHQTEEML